MADASNETQLDETAAVARDLIRFDTTNYGNGRANSEREATEYIADYLKALGVASTIVESEPGRTSLVARIPGKNPNLPALVVHGHTDVVPADASSWSVDPFAGVIRDGMLWGRGAVDMKNMDAMILTSVAGLLRAGEAPNRELVVAFFADEEDGGRLGAHYVVSEHPQLFNGATEAISEVGGYSIDLEGRRAYLLQTGEKAMLWLKLRAKAKSAHGSLLVKENAVTALAAAVARIGAEPWPVTLTTTTTALLDELAKLLGEDASGQDPDKLVARLGTAAGFIHATLRNTSNPTGLNAGYKHNVIPESAEALIDVRPLPGAEDAVMRRIRELAGPKIEVEIANRNVGLESPLTGSLVDAMVGALQKHDPGAPVLPYLMSGGTDNKALSRLGITGYGFAPLQLPPELDFPAMFHGVDERVPLEALVFGRNVLSELLANY